MERVAPPTSRQLSIEGSKGDVEGTRTDGLGSSYFARLGGLGCLADARMQVDGQSGVAGGFRRLDGYKSGRGTPIPHSIIALMLPCLSSCSLQLVKLVTNVPIHHIHPHPPHRQLAWHAQPHIHPYTQMARLQMEPASPFRHETCMFDGGNISNRPAATWVEWGEPRG